MYTPPAGAAPESRYQARRVTIRDARAAAGLSIDTHGFELRAVPTAVRDFFDDDGVRRAYYPEVIAAVRAATGARDVRVFDHQVRLREPDHPPLTFGRDGNAMFPSAAGRAHNDYTEASGRARLALVLPADRAAAVQRYAIVNVWRSITDYPVLDTPLAVCDARSVAPADLVASDVRYPSRTGEIYVVVYDPRHAWSYFSAMQRDEIMIFKQYDSITNGVARFTPHAAFDHPEMPPGAPPRRSIEARCLVVYE